MKRNQQVAAALIIVVLLVGVIYVADPELLGSLNRSGSNANGSSASVSETGSLTVTSLSGPGDFASVSVGATLTASPQGSTSAAGQAWTTYHGDNARDGYVPTNFTSAATDWTTKVDGAVYAEPLLYGGDVFVATENNSVHALSGHAGNVLWRTNLGAPVQGSQLQCGDISPSGITGTPVIDPSTSTLFVVSFDGSSLSHVLSAINTNTGAILWQKPADPANFVETAQQERSALSLADGMVYIPYGGLDGDCGQYHGYVVGIPENGTGSMVTYQVPTSREGGIWAPSGAAVDPSGNVYVSTGNGASSTTFDHGDTVIKLSSSLAEEGYFAPSDWQTLNQDDADLGSVGPAIVGSSQLFQIGKSGVGYLLDASNLGGIGGQAFEASVCGGSYGGTAFANEQIFVPCDNGLYVLKLSGSTFSGAWHTSSFDAGPPTVTGGIVWTVDITNATLMGFSSSSGHKLYSFSLGGVEHFTGPAADDSQLVVPADDRVVCFGLG